MALWAIPIGLLGARLYYVLFELGYYLQNSGQILAIWNGGIAIYGGLIAGGGTLYWYAKKKGTSLALVLDILAPNVLLAQSIGRWGNFMNQELMVDRLLVNSWKIFIYLNLSLNK